MPWQNLVSAIMAGFGCCHLGGFRDSPSLCCVAPFTLPLLLVPSVHSSLRVSQVVHGRFLVARLVGGNFRIVGRVPPGRCSRIAPRLSDSGEAFPLVWKRPGRELAVALHPIPPRLDRPNIRL